MSSELKNIIEIREQYDNDGNVKEDLFEVHCVGEIEFEVDEPVRYFDDPTTSRSDAYEWAEECREETGAPIVWASQLPIPF